MYISLGQMKQTVTGYAIRTRRKRSSGRELVQFRFDCKKTNYFKKKYFTNFANYMMSLLLDMARESSKFIYEIILKLPLFAV